MRDRGDEPRSEPADDGGWLVGRRQVAEALEGMKSGGTPVEKVWVLVEPAVMAWWSRGAAQLAREARVPVMRVPRHALDRLVPGSPHQGVVARAAAAPTLELADLLAGLPRTPLLVLADGVEDPRNLGALIRSCAAAGVHGLVLPERRSAGLTPLVARAAAGTLDRVKVARVKNVVRALEDLGKHGIWTLGLAAGESPLWDADLRRPTCLVVGGEDRGLARLTRERCDALAGIPIAGGVESLNVSVAAGVALFEALRQRSRGAT